jgi:hypothetical protein
VGPGNDLQEQPGERIVKSLLFGLSVGLVVAAAGCANIIQGMAQGGAGGGDARAPGDGGIYTGAECAKYQSEDPRSEGVFRTYEDDTRRPIFKGDRKVGLTPAEGVIFLTCVDATGGDGASSTNAIVADHLDFDDRRFDNLRAAAMVMDCAQNADCGLANSRDVLGMMAGYARRIDPAGADAALGAAGGSAPLREAFSAKLAWARAVIETRVAQLDPRRQAIWVDIPEQVWTERAAYYKQWSSLYAALDPLLATDAATDAAARATIRELTLLRGRYLDACKVEGCLFTAFVLETTRAIALRAVRIKDVPLALAEADLLRDDRLTSQFFSRAMLSALLPATKREYEQWQKYDSAERGGADAAALEAMFGKVPPIHISADGPWIVWGSRDLPDLTAALPKDEVESAGGNVRTTRRQGDRATVIFADVVSTYDEEDCHETNRIDGIGSDGRIIYRQICKKTGTRTERRKIDPIEVPSTDADRLRAGDLVSAWVTSDGRRGSITNIEREGKLVQVRGHRLKVPESRRSTRW